MAEKPGPVEDEVERALASMRTGFLSGAYEIAAGVSSLEEHLAEAPHDEREALRAEVGKLVAAQERLRTRLERLPGTSWDRFKAMVSLVKAQQTILDQVGDLVKKHVLPRQVENLSAAAETAAGPTAVQAPRASAAQRAASVHHGDEEERRPLFGRAGGWARANGGLAAMVAAGIVLSLIPRETRLQDLAAKLIDMVGAKIEPAASGADTTAATEPTPVQPAAPKVLSSEERAPKLSDVAEATDRPGAPGEPSGPPDQKRPAPAPDLAARPGPPAKAAPAAKHAAVSAPPGEPAKAVADAPQEKFVPVVFTHQDQETVMRALSDLQQLYAKVLIGRRGEVQPVDLGKKGIWHRLVFLPAGARPDAARLCDQLMAEGYDRCWVKSY